MADGELVQVQKAGMREAGKVGQGFFRLAELQLRGSGIVAEGGQTVRVAKSLCQMLRYRKWVIISSTRPRSE